MSLSSSPARTAAILSFLAACGTGDSPLDIPLGEPMDDLPFSLPATSAPPLHLDAEIGPLVPGTKHHTTIEGGPAHGVAYLLASSRPTGRACPRALGGGCLDIGGPFSVLGYAATDAEGRAALSADVAADLDEDLELQVVVTDGTRSGLSDAAWRVPHDNHWAYESEAGPTHWPELSSEWAACEGARQSPVDIGGSVPGPTETLAFQSGGVAKDLVNNGHTWQVNYKPGNYLYVDDVPYGLLQLHFHTPSEHRVSGVPYPLEMHLVHADPWGGLAVVGVFFEEGAPSTWLDTFWSAMPTAKGSATSPGPIPPYANLPGSLNHASYSGSLTTPPCSEIVRWLVLDTPMSASTAQIDALLASVSENARPTQPLDGRVVQARVSVSAP